MRRLAISAILVSLMGCFPDRPSTDYHVAIDPAFGDRLELVLDAVDQWQKAIQQNCTENGGDCHLLFLHVVIVEETCDKECKDTITIHPSTKDVIDLMPGGDSNAIGICHRKWVHFLGTINEWSNIYLDEDLNIPAFHQAAMHEFGHGLGLKHSGEGSLMCSNVGCAVDYVTDIDIKQYLDLRQ